MTPRGGYRPGSGAKPLPPGKRGERIMLYLPGWLVRWLRANLTPGERSGYVSRAVLAQIERESAKEKGNK